MNIKIYTKFTGIDKFGMPIAEEKRDYEESHSLVQAFPGILRAQFEYSTGSVTIPDIGNAGRAVVSNQYGFAVTAGTDTTLVGPQAGTGTGAVAITDYALGTRIVHGTGSGQLQYSAVSFGAWTVSAPDAYCKIFRTFTNGSGGNITINEIGLYCRGNSTAGHYFCIERTLPTPYTVNNGAGVILEYKFLYTV